MAQKKLWLPASLSPRPPQKPYSKRMASTLRATEIILRREILSSGKGRVFVNNQPATVAVLRQLAPELALVHAQSETLSSFDQTQQRILLDRFAAISTDETAAAYEAWCIRADQAG